jgi:wobble nucleotide-excising tRNase
LLAEYEKKKLELAKEEAKVALEQHSESVFQTYQGDINRLLGMFGANFHIENTRGQYRGDAPSYSYALVINDTAVDVGDARTPLSKPSFKNTLSAGDRSTLALSFFLARLRQDPQLSDRTVVFDDPFTSQDRSRRTCTQQELCRLAAKAKQVIVLSHDAPFLKLIWDDLAAGDVKTLQLARLGPGSTVTEWDIENHVKDDYFKNHAELRKYRDYGEGDPRHVAKTIRILLEGYLRFKLPGSFDDKDWLGDYVRAIGEAQADDPIAAAQGILQDLEDLKNYAKRYHHAQNPNADSEPLDEGELENFVRRTLNLVGGF